MAPLDAITNRSKIDNSSITSSLSDSDLNAAASAAAGKAVAFIFITADSGEGGYIVEGNAGDRNDLQAWHGGVSEFWFQFRDLLTQLAWEGCPC